MQVVESRLFSEGLHVLGKPPEAGQMAQYLAAYFGPDLPEEAVEAVVQAGDRGLDAVRCGQGAVLREQHSAAILRIEDNEDRGAARLGRDCNGIRGVTDPAPPMSITQQGAAGAAVPAGGGGERRRRWRARPRRQVRLRASCIFEIDAAPAVTLTFKETRPC